MSDYDKPAPCGAVMQITTIIASRVKIFSYIPVSSSAFISKPYQLYKIQLFCQLQDRKFFATETQSHGAFLFSGPLRLCGKKSQYLIELIYHESLIDSQLQTTIDASYYSKNFEKTPGMAQNKQGVSGSEDLKR